jgi:hypothetical protein
VDVDRQEAEALVARAVDHLMRKLDLLPALVDVCATHGTAALAISDDLTVVYGEQGHLCDSLGRLLHSPAEGPWMVLWACVGADPDGDPRVVLVGVVEDAGDVERALVTELEVDVAEELVGGFRSARVG